ILKNELELFNGIIIENKEYSVSVHYRLAEENTVEKILEIVSNMIDLHDLNKEFKMLTGKMVVEILPSNFSKDKAVNYLINSQPDYFPVYFGDDITDISALREVIKHKGIAISVGSTDFILADEVNQLIKISELIDFIKYIAKEIKCL
ncbi:MAG: trehalose-phosphatase, partial [Candidatus Gastranaerophilales bacterium]|nr:trehalose-phosphatase [Candidatus Gastranaerophilales bacterium]